MLSGGEKTRVAMARILVDPGNLLLLDEPTNHLDTESAERLTESLMTYDGTILFVSHNLDFARRLSNKVWIVEDGGVRPYPGSLGDYLEQVSAEQARLERDVAPDAPAPKPAPVDKQDRQREREAKKERRRERSKLERRIATLETEVADLETRQVELEEVMADPATLDDRERYDKLVAEHREVVDGLATRMEAWEQAAADLEALGDDD